MVDVVNVRDNGSLGELIERATHSGVILPGGEWHTLAHSGLTGMYEYIPCVS